MAKETVLVIDDSPTILKVVQLVLGKAGYTVLTASDGDEGVEQAREHRPDLILLDFVMPRMNGYQVCRELHQDTELAAIPVVLMSAKGDQVGDRFVKVMGIVDYITKPFSHDAISEAVGKALARVHEQSEATESVDALLPDLAPEARINAAEVQNEARRTALSQLRQNLHLAIVRLLHEGVEDQAQLEESLAKLLEDEQLEVWLGDMRASAPDLLGAGDAALTGDLEKVPLAEVLVLLSEQQQTGTLSITRGDAQVDVHLLKGKLNLATAAGLPEEFLLGRFILQRDLMPSSELELFLQSRVGNNKLLGHQLVKLGYITADELKEAINQQSTELIYELLRWRQGRFSFREAEKEQPVAADAALALSLEGLLMEGLRRVDDWHIVQRDVGDHEHIFVREDEALAQLGRGALSREELAVLELINGKNSTKDVIRLSRMGSFEVSRMLQRLLAVKLIRQRVEPVAV
jgi:CheY-like chemotaxis protein